MSWKATAYVKALSHGTSGEALTRGEKGILMVLSDYYNDEQHMAWPSVKKVARDALMSERRTRQLLHTLVDKGVIYIQHREDGNGGLTSSAYRIVGYDPHGPITKPTLASCANCASSEELREHHVVPLAKGGRDIASNRITLCHHCHVLAHHPPDTAAGGGAVASVGAAIAANGGQPQEVGKFAKAAKRGTVIEP